MQIKKECYLLYRKIKAFGARCFFLLCRIFPIKRNRISVCTFEGKGGFGCNPRYIVEELHRRNPDYEFIWFVNDMNKEFPDYIKKVPNDLKNRAYWLSTSKIWIDNYRKPYGTTKRKGQYYVNTWHATIAFKSIGLWREEAFSKIAYLVSHNDSKMIDDIFRELQKNKMYMAAVVDEYGGTSGLVTLEDIVEEIVGDISDEFDKEPENEYYKKIDNETYIFKAQISMVDFCKVFEIDDDYFEEVEGESDTLAGMILEIEGRIPEAGFKCSYGDFTFEIVESDKKHIIKIKVTRKDEE